MLPFKDSKMHINVVYSDHIQCRSGETCSKDVSSASVTCSALNNLLIFLAACVSLEGLKVFLRAKYLENWTLPVDHKS